MTNKRLVYGVHVLGRMRRRGVTRQMVRDVMARGAVGSAYNRKGSEPRQAKQLYFGRHELKVVYIERAEEIEFVTVEWTDYWKV